MCGAIGVLDAISKRLLFPPTLKSHTRETCCLRESHVSIKCMYIMQPAPVNDLDVHSLKKIYV